MPFSNATVIVCTYRRPLLLQTCIRSLLAQERPPAEIVIVDNAPQDRRTRRLLQRRFPSCRYTAEPRRGIAFARNRGLRSAGGDILAFVDDDCQAKVGWLQRLTEPFRDNSRLGCCTGPVLPLELKTTAQRLMEDRGGFSKGFQRRLFTQASAHDSGNYPVQAWIFGTGANMAFRRSTFETIGGFDETPGFAEDLDIFYRVIRAGFELLYEPQAAVLHRHPETRRALRRSLFYWGWGYVSFLKKVARNDALYHRIALRELKSWIFSFQLQDRLLGKFRQRETAGFPLELILAEFSGGLAALLAFHPHGAACNNRSTAA